MNIYEALRKDHDHHRQLLEKISDTSGDTKERQELFTKLFVDVESHAAAEEQTFYAELISKMKVQPQARHSVTEHKDTSDLLEELISKDMSSPGWLVKFNTLKEELEHHMLEEEQDVFEMAKKTLSTEDAEAMAEDFKSRKSKEVERKVTNGKA